MSPPLRPRLSRLFLALTILCACCQACPFYLDLPTLTSPTTNFTRFSDALAAAIANSLPLIVCDQAKITANETIPTITSSVVITGELTPGSPFPYLTVENLQLDPIFVIDAANGDVVLFENLQIDFKTTLFSIQGQAQLTLLNFKCWFGITCVQVSTLTTGSVPPGLAGDTAVFMGNAIGILHNTGFVTCNHCTFYDSLVAAILTRNPAPNPFIYITLYDHHYQNVLFPLAAQTAIEQPLVAPELSPSYVDMTDFFACFDYQKPSSTEQLFGSAGCPPTTTACPVCASCQNTSSPTQIIFSIGLLLLIAFVISTCASRNRTAAAARREKTGR